MIISYLNIATVFLLIFNPPQQAIEALSLSWVFCDSCLSVRVFQRGRVLAQHDNDSVSMGTPAF